MIFIIRKEKRIIDTYYLNFSVSGERSVILKESLFVFGGWGYDGLTWALVQICNFGEVAISKDEGDNNLLIWLLIIGMSIILVIATVMIFVIKKRRRITDDQEYVLMALHHEQVLSK